MDGPGGLGNCTGVARLIKEPYKGSPGRLGSLHKDGLGILGSLHKGGPGRLGNLHKGGSGRLGSLHKGGPGLTKSLSKGGPGLEEVLVRAALSVLFCRIYWSRFHIRAPSHFSYAFSI